MPVSVPACSCLPVGACLLVSARRSTPARRSAPCGCLPLVSGGWGVRVCRSRRGCATRRLCAVPWSRLSASRHQHGRRAVISTDGRHSARTARRHSARTASLSARAVQSETLRAKLRLPGPAGSSRVGAGRGCATAGPHGPRLERGRDGASSPAAVAVDGGAPVRDCVRVSARARRAVAEAPGTTSVQRSPGGPGVPGVGGWDAPISPGSDGRSPMRD